MALLIRCNWLNDFELKKEKNVARKDTFIIRVLI